MPRKSPVNGANGVGIWRPGYIGNILIGAVAAIVSWGLYGPFSAAYLFGTSPVPETTPQKFGLTLSAFVGAVLVGVGGAKWLSDEVDKRLLKAAASEAAKKSLRLKHQLKFWQPRQPKLSMLLGECNVSVVFKKITL